MRNGAESQQDPRVWWQALQELLASLQSRLGGNARAIAIAIDGTSATLLLCDERGIPVSPALMYDDSRARPEAERIAARAPAACAAVGASSSLAKLLNLHARHPNARHALHQADWLTAKLLGTFTYSDENNVLKLGYDPVARVWPDWLEGMEFPRRLLPEVVPPGTVLGRLSPQAAQLPGLGADTLVVAGTTDSTAAFLATGARQVGEAVTSLGSTLVLKVLTDTPVFAPEYGIYSHRLQHRWLTGGASNSGGAALLDYFSRAELERLTPLLDPAHPTGLDYYPLRGPGERFPVADPDLAPRLSPRPAQAERFLQGLLEGIAAIEVQGYGLLAQLGAPYPSFVRTVGGGAHNPAWTAIRQARLGVPLVQPAHQDACYGAALLARAGALGVPLWEEPDRSRPTS